MAVTREQFERGMTYADYKAQMTRNQDQFEQNEAGLALSAEDVEAFRALPRPLHVLALAEDWCGDVIANLPILGRIANESGAAASSSTSSMHPRASHSRTTSLALDQSRSRRDLRISTFPEIAFPPPVSLPASLISCCEGRSQPDINVSAKVSAR